MFITKTFHPMQTSMRLALCAAAVSLGMLSAASAQTAAPTVPAPSTIPVPPEAFRGIELFAEDIQPISDTVVIMTDTRWSFYAPNECYSLQEVERGGRRLLSEHGGGIRNNVHGRSAT